MYNVRIYVGQRWWQQLTVTMIIKRLPVAGHQNHDKRSSSLLLQLFYPNFCLIHIGGQFLPLPEEDDREYQRKHQCKKRSPTFFPDEPGFQARSH